MHPLYPAVDHIQCGTKERGHQIVCYALNDVKGHLPFDCFEALKQYRAMERVNAAMEFTGRERPTPPGSFKRLIFPNGNRRKK